MDVQRYSTTTSMRSPSHGANYKPVSVYRRYIKMERSYEIIFMSALM